MYSNSDRRVCHGSRADSNMTTILRPVTSSIAVTLCLAQYGMATKFTIWISCYKLLVRKTWVSMTHISLWQSNWSLTLMCSVQTLSRPHNVWYTRLLIYVFLINQTIREAFKIFLYRIIPINYLRFYIKITKPTPWCLPLMNCWDFRT